MTLKKGKNTFTTTDPVQIAAFKKNGYTEVKPRSTQQAKQDNAVPEEVESAPEAEDTGDAI